MSCVSFLYNRLMLKYVFYLILFSALSIFVVGCQTAEPGSEQTATAVTSAPAATATELPSVAEDISQPTATSALEERPTAQPTATLAASQADTPVATPTATPTATPVPTNPLTAVSLVPVSEGAFVRPLYLTHAGDDRLFVVEQAGVIRIIEQGQLLETPFLDIRDKVGSSQLEQGLLGLAFHPNYDEYGTFFVNYTNPSGNSHISRFRVDEVDANQANPDSETILLTYQQPYPNHNGGQVAFGPDGNLYVGVGDGGSANDPLNSGQDPSTILGSILRLDVNQPGDSYSIPPSNPFVGNDSALDEIWAWGLRNPWRFSFDRLTGDLFIADVGQNLWEEIHFQPAESQGGENYGWNIMEGTHCFASNPCETAGLEMPIFEYSHEQGCSITGGYMYRGSAYPEMYGNYLVADYCQGTIWRLFPEASGEWSSAVVFDSNYVISSFGEDAAGELYVLDHNGGSVYRITP